MNSYRKIITVIGLILIFCSSPVQSQEILIKSGQKIAFLGDSITAMGNAPPGYIQQVIRGLEANGIKATAIPAGVGGNTSVNMLARLGGDVIASHPDWMTLSCGVNDVWSDLPLDQYKDNMTKIIEKAHAAKIKVILLTATGIGEAPSEKKNLQMVPYNEFVRQLAIDNDCPFADLNAELEAAIIASGGGAGSKRGNVMTIEGIHPNALGHEVMAIGILKAMGLNADQIQKARDAWLDIPYLCEADLKGGLTLRQYQQLDALAAKQNRPTSEVIHDLVAKILDAPPPQDGASP